jgi:hypothetical protein
MQNLTLLPLHGGKAPRWLFSRMVRLGSLITETMIDEYGSSGLIDRLTDPMWFQALACAIGYDWHSSGTTTVVVAALKEALNYHSDIFIAGGKGKQGTSAPEQIVKGVDYLSMPGCDERFIHYSRIAAKIDSALVYDNLGIYHHAFIFSKGKDWAVIQQGMHAESNMAVRFQISGKSLDKNDITNETNSAVASGLHESTMDLTFERNGAAKQHSLRLVNEDFGEIENAKPVYKLPARHEILDTDLSKRAVELLKAANEMQPGSYEELLSIKGIGRKTLRSLAIISSLLYDNEIYKRDPIMYSYNLGGKDGIPYRINLGDYDDVVSALSEIVKSIKAAGSEKEHILKVLNREVSQAYLACKPDSGRNI